MSHADLIAELRGGVRLEDHEGQRLVADLARTRTVYAQALAALEGDGWIRDGMAGAPKDGTKILVSSSKKPQWVEIAAHTQNPNAHKKNPWREGGPHGRVVFYDPDMWRPIPMPKVTT